VTQTTLNANELKAAVQTSQALATELIRFMKSYSDQTPPGCYLARGSQAIQVNKTNVTESGIDAILKHLNEKRTSASVGKRLQQGLFGPSEALATHEVTAEFLEKLRAYLKNPGSATGPTFKCEDAPLRILAQRFEKTANDLKPLYKQSEGPGMFGGRTRRRMRKAGFRLVSSTPPTPPPPKNDKFSNENPLAKDTIEKNALKVKVRAKLKQAYKDQPFVDNMVPGLTLEQLRKIDEVDTNDKAALDTVVIPINSEWAKGEEAKKKGASRRKSRRKSSTRRR
jgi:hypothetical protein